MLENFKFWCPIEKSEGLDPTSGEVLMKLGGIASTSDEDSDGEFLDPKGFDIQPLMKSGMVNWHHQAKDQPNAIIGEPLKAEIRPEGLYLETLLYTSSKIACDVWELAETLEKDSKTRRLGYSIEGKVVKRKSENKNSPDYKKIVKAIITGVAVTHQPKNPKTFANIIKGEIDEFEDEIEEAVDTENAAALKKESVDKKIKNKTLSKSQIMERVFKDIPGISIEKAEKLNNLFIKIAKMEGRKKVTEEDISKAYEALGLNVEEEDINKGCNSEGGESTSKEPISKADTKKAEESEESEETEDEDETDDEEESEEDVEKGDNNRFDRIEKAIATGYANNTKYIKALGVMVKDVAQKADAIFEENVSLKEIIKAQEDTILSMSEKLEAYGSEVPAPRSISNARTIDRQFDKGQENENFGRENSNSGARQVSMSRQKGLVSEILDQATFAKGYDEEFSRATTHFESTNSLPSSIIARIKTETGIDIVK